MANKKIVNTTLRLPISLHKLVISSADDSNRSMNAELVTRLDYAVQKDLFSPVEFMKKEEIQKTSLRLPIDLHDKLIELAKVTTFEENGFNDEMVRRLRGSFDAGPAVQQELHSIGAQITSYPLRMPPLMRQHYETTALHAKRTLHAELIFHLSNAMAEVENKVNISPSSRSVTHRVVIDDVAYHSESDVVIVNDPDLRYRLQQAMGDQDKINAIADLLQKLTTK
ncbi:hypothetical protein [Aeromonas hydrophila]|uniref:hypothetical protein n=1 Tax=Aeromonas hydrophila TaxID=644 RepID=UPI002B4916AA|nr:hypothetical protein [Aeromonas hydrophila]